MGLRLEENLQTFIGAPAKTTGSERASLCLSTHSVSLHVLEIRLRVTGLQVPLRRGGSKNVLFLHFFHLPLSDPASSSAVKEIGETIIREIEMSTMKITCPACGKALEVVEAWIGMMFI